jgi:hypothetical protein
MSKLHNHLSEIIWADSKVIGYSFDSTLNVFELKIVNYHSEKIRIVFTNIQYNFLDDPVYISSGNFSKSNGLCVAEFSDDDGIVIKLVYENSKVSCL